MYLDIYKNVSRRCVLLACSPHSINSIALMFAKRCGFLNRVIFWPATKSRIQSHMLIEASSTDNLVSALEKMHIFRAVHYGRVKHNIIFRALSDPSVWPIDKLTLTTTNISSAIGTNIVVQKSAISKQKLWDNLLLCDSIDAQASLLVDSLELTEFDLISRCVLVNSIEDVLHFILPETKVSVFGSLASGLGSVYSDMDMSVSLSTTISISDWSKEAFGSMFVKNMHLSNPEHLQRLFLVFLQRMLTFLDPLGFNNSKIFPSRVPILHVPKYGLLGVGLDISRSVNCNVGQENSNFDSGVCIAFILSLFVQHIPNFKKSVMCLKYIAIQSKAIQAYSTLTSFKLTMLFIHCLQINNYAPPLKDLFPMVEAYIRNNDHSLIPIDDGCTFYKQFDVQPIPNIESILNCFISYMVNLQLKKDVVIDLLLGKSISKEAFVNSMPGRIDQLDFLFSKNHVASSDIDFIWNDVVVCPNPFYPYKNIMGNIYKRKWKDLIYVCWYWKECLNLHNKQQSLANQQMWGLVRMCKREEIKDNLVYR